MRARSDEGYMKTFLLVAVMLAIASNANAQKLLPCDGSFIHVEAIVQPEENNMKTFYNGSVEIYNIDTALPPWGRENYTSGIAVIIHDKESKTMVPMWGRNWGKKCWAIIDLKGVDIKSVKASYKPYGELLLRWPDQGLKILIDFPKLSVEIIQGQTKKLSKRQLANVRTLSSRFLGNWCWIPGTNEYEPTTSTKTCSGLSWLTVRPDGYEAADGTDGPHEYCHVTQFSAASHTIQVSCYLYVDKDRYEKTMEMRLESGHLILREDTQNEIVTYECAGFRGTPPEPVERDPVVKVVIEHRKGSPPIFNVKHVTLAGETFVRNDQYRDIRVWTGRGGDDFWSGVSIKNPSRSMVGNLAWDNSRGIAARRYIEKQFNRGRLERTVVSTCVP
jgi:hypothetical protein